MAHGQRFSLTTWDGFYDQLHSKVLRFDVGFSATSLHPLHSESGSTPLCLATDSFAGTSDVDEYSFSIFRVFVFPLFMLFLEIAFSMYDRRPPVFDDMTWVWARGGTFCVTNLIPRKLGAMMSGLALNVWGFGVSRWIGTGLMGE